MFSLEDIYAHVLWPENAISIKVWVGRGGNSVPAGHLAWCPPCAQGTVCPQERSKPQSSKHWLLLRKKPFPLNLDQEWESLVTCSFPSSGVILKPCQSLTSQSHTTWHCRCMIFHDDIDPHSTANWIENWLALAVKISKCLSEVCRIIVIWTEQPSCTCCGNRDF